MKYLFIAITLIIAGIIIVQVYFTISSRNIESHRYTVLSEKGNIELRKYEPAVFIGTGARSAMFEKQNKLFRVLAGYIFGGNSGSEKIAMTAPVQMQQDGDSTLMRFMIPSAYKKNELPEPDDGSVILTEEAAFTAAVIRYGGFNSEQKFQKNKKLLEEFIQAENLKIEGNFIYLGYNPPFQWFGRRNEVMVKIMQ